MIDNPNHDSPFHGKPQHKETLDILYQDEWLIAVHKPAGLLVHKSPIDKHETRYAMKLLRDQINQWVYPIHRLDKPTSGLLLFALDKDMAQKMAALFEAREIHKTYQAFVRGFTPDSGNINHPLKEIAAFKHLQKTLEKMAPKEAETDYRCLSTFELPYPDGRFETSRYSYVELYPKTGRKHQIRRHLKHISHPIIGDVKYGKGPHNRRFKDTFECSRLLLAATDISFNHPLLKQDIQINCPLATDFSNLLSRVSVYKSQEF